jgi:uncharacterized protein (TIGR03437 family)
MLKGILCGFLLSVPLFSQTIVGSGYTAPAPVSVAPGQVATFFVAGLASPLTGITAMLQQNGGSTPAPVQSVRPVSLCPDLAGTSVSCGTLTAVTVQIPYELVPACPLCARPVSAVPPTLVIAQNGQTGTAIELNPLGDEVHVLTSCDVVLGVPSTPRPLNLTGLPCTPIVTHADGSAVSAAKPANAGEELVIWAFGLGQTNPPAATGQASAMAPAGGTFYLNFDYAVNALATKPFIGSPDRIPLTPAFAGLAAGYVGLYQINFVVPPGPPNGIAQCALPGTVAPGGNAAQSNLTVSIGGQFSFDGAGICVVTQIPVD